LPTTHSYCWSLLCETDSAFFDYLNTCILSIDEISKRTYRQQTSNVDEDVSMDAMPVRVFVARHIAIRQCQTRHRHHRHRWAVRTGADRYLTTESVVAAIAVVAVLTAMM
jgi:hypothetical protein